MRNQPQSLLSRHEQEVSLSHSPNPRKRYAMLFAVAAILIASGTAVWVLNIVGIIPGPWSSVFAAIFAGSGIIIALLDSWKRLSGGEHGN